MSSLLVAGHGHADVKEKLAERKSQSIVYRLFGRSTYVPPVDDIKKQAIKDGQRRWPKKSDDYWKAISLGLSYKFLLAQYNEYFLDEFKNQSIGAFKKKLQLARRGDHTWLELEQKTKNAEYRLKLFIANYIEKNIDKEPKNRTVEIQTDKDSTTSQKKRVASRARYVKLPIDSTTQAPYGHCAIRKGKVWCWGEFVKEASAQKIKRKPYLKQVVGMTHPVLALSGGGSHFCAIDSTHRVSCWGIDRATGATGQNQADFVSIDAFPVTTTAIPGRVRTITTGNSASCAGTATGVYCWGTRTDRFTKMGLGTKDPDFGKVMNLEAGRGHVCSVVDDQAWCWGTNSHAQINDDLQYVRFPTLKKELKGDVFRTSSGDDHSCAIVDGDVYCWGKNTSGQIGVDGQKTAPQKVVGMTDASSISAGNGTTCVVRNRKVYCWGAFTGTSIPKQIRGIRKHVDHVSVGQQVCAMDELQDVYCAKRGKTFEKLAIP